MLILGGGADAFPEAAEPSTRERVPPGQCAAEAAGRTGQRDRPHPAGRGGRPPRRPGHDRPGAPRRRERHGGREGPRRGRRGDGREGLQGRGREGERGPRTREAELPGPRAGDRRLERKPGTPREGRRGRSGGDGVDAREGGRRPRRRRPRSRHRLGQEGLETEREDPPRAPVVLLLQRASAHPVREEPEPQRRPHRGPPLSRAHGDGEQRLPERPRIHEGGTRHDPGGPHLRAGEGDPRRGGPDAVCRGARRGHDQGFEPDRAGPGRHHQSRLREGEERAEPEPRGIGESPPAIARGERGGFLAHRPGGEGDGRRPDGRAGPVREGRGRDPQRSVPGSGSAREARVPDGPADAVSAGRRSPRDVPREIRRRGEHGRRSEGAVRGPEHRARGDPPRRIPRSPRLRQARGWRGRRDPRSIPQGRGAVEGAPPGLRRGRGVRRADGTRSETRRGRPPGVQGSESTGGREGDPSVLRRTAEGGARAGDGGPRARGIHLDVGRTERRGPGGTLEVAPGSDRRGEGGRLPPGAGPRRRRAGEGGADPRRACGRTNLLPSDGAPPSRG